MRELEDELAAWKGCEAALVFPAGCSSRATPEEETTLPFKLGEVSPYLADVNVPYPAVPYVEPLQTRHLDFGPGAVTGVRK